MASASRRNVQASSRNDPGVGRQRELVAAALRGEPAAFASLVGTSRGAVHAVLARMLPEADVDDVLQEAFLRAFLGLSQLRDPERFVGWVCGIAVNLAKMRLRRSALQSRVLAAGGGAQIVELGASEDERDLLELAATRSSCCLRLSATPSCSTTSTISRARRSPGSSARPPVPFACVPTVPARSSGTSSPPLRPFPEPRRERNVSWSS